MAQDLDHRSPDTLHAPFGYSHIVSAPAGRTVWISGQIALEPDGTPAPLEWESQARLVFANLSRALEAAGATFADVVKVTYFLVDLAGLPVVRKVRDEHFDPERLPASTLIQVAGLARPDLLLEIEAVAALPER
jgi:enamine deaminase RidA (YjgF/YER057c/UK114 family)